MKERRKPECPEKTLATSFRKCHILKPEHSSPSRDSNPRASTGGRLGKQTLHHSNPHSSIGGRLGKQTLHHVSPQNAIHFHQSKHTE